MNETIDNINRLKNELEHSRAKENAKSIDGAIYGLDLAIGVIKATARTEENGKD